MFSHLRAFHHVVQEGSIKAAAIEMGVTQPNVSYHIKQLEIKFGKVIKDRKLTPLGRDLAVRIYYMVTTYEKLLNNR